jgi:predicted TIM-barrel fold metal-dependent hydrolase
MTRDYRTIDADAHVNPPPTFWAEYLPSEFQDLAPRLEEGEDVDYIVFEGTRHEFSRVNDQAGVQVEERKTTGKVTGARRGGFDPTARLEDMDEDHIDAAVIFGGGPLGSQNFDLYVASFHAYNAWLADFCSAAPDRLFGMAYIPMFEVDQAVEELRWSADHGLRGVVIPAFAPERGYTGGALNLSNVIMYAEHNQDRTYADAEFDPFWRVASELGMPLHVHLGAAKPNVTDAVDSRFRFQMRSKLAMAEVVVHFVMSGILPAHPDLKLVSVESGVGWMAFAAEYLDNTWHKHRHTTNSPITIEPSNYMDRQVYGTFLEDAAGVQNRNLKGGRNIMWSSDYPHSETTWPNSKESIERSLKDVPADEAYRIVAGNAKSLYNLS